MGRKSIFAVMALLIASLLFVAAIYFFQDKIVMLNTKGIIAEKQRNLILIATAVMSIVVIPVFVMAFFITKNYHVSRNAEYKPEWDYSFIAEFVWWSFPLVIVIALSVLAWKTSHELDPFNAAPTNNGKPSKVIQVIALQWKWLFIYPEEKIASLNYVQFPKETPLVFEITADAPMNSFWIPQLGGQIYAMPAMKTLLHLIADEAGIFYGSSANISGAGYSSMYFDAEATTDENFDAWVKKVKEGSQPLDLNTYNNLAKPSSYDPVETFVLKKEDLFDWVVMKPLQPEQPLENAP